MHLKPIVAVTGFACAVLLTSTGMAVGEPEKPTKKPTENEVKELMIKAHRGEKSPLGRTGAELKKETPDWDQIVKGSKVLGEMGTALKGFSGHTAPTRYVNAAMALEKAAGEKDKKSAGEAFLRLTKSCSSCHYGGAPR